MSGDPERLLSVGSGADSVERQLLESVRHVGPPSAAKAEAWSAIAAQVAVAAAVGTAAGSTAAASKVSATGFASWALASKIAGVALGGGLAAGGSYLALRAPSDAPVRAVVAPKAEQAPPVVVSPPPARDASPTSLPSLEEAPSRKLEPRRVDALKAESALLMQARAELRSGNASAAQGTLERLQAQFPKGVLAQEREVLSIEVLHARGNAEGARRRAKSFIKAHPKSPHSQKLARFVE